jgi:hypothetical protein
MIRRVYRELVDGDAWELAKGRLLGALFAAAVILVASAVVVGGLS